MSGRALRPCLSKRYQALTHQTQRRSLAGHSEAHIPPPARRPSRRLGPLSWTALAFALAAGPSTGAYLRRNVTKPPYADPFTSEDRTLVSELTKRIDEVFKVKVLRGKCLGVAKQLKGQEGGWKEVVYQEDQALMPSTFRSTLAGARGLGVERLFWNKSDEVLVAIVWFGPSMSGWPGVTHGGVIATQFMDKIGLAKGLANGSDAQVSKASQPQRMPGSGEHAKIVLSTDDFADPSELSLSYVKPTFTENFYLLRVSRALPLAADPAAVVPSEPPDGHHEWEATLESMDGSILVKANASFDHATALGSIDRRVGEVVDQAYGQFRQWMWPSRQGSLHGSRH